MVPRRVVRVGLLVESTGASSLPFGLIGLLWQVMVSFEEKKKKKRRGKKDMVLVC